MVAVRARIDEKREARIRQRFQQCLAWNSGFHRGLQILRADAHHFVHLAHVDGDAAVNRVHLRFHRRARAERNHRAPDASR